jgi:hypothetical protein
MNHHTQVIVRYLDSRFSNVLSLLSVIPALGKLRQKDIEFKASLGYTARYCVKIKILLYNYKGH